MWLVKIKRKTSDYNKYILWQATGEAENGAKFCFGYKTLNEARERYNKDGYKVIEIDKGKGNVWKNIAYN